MKVMLAPADEHGCGHYRMRFPAMTAGPAIEYEFVEGFPAIRTRSLPATVVGVERLDADVVVMQRPLNKHLGDLIPHIQKQGIAVVVDIDDDFSCLHHAHPTFNAVHPKRNRQSNWHHLKHACALADVVTTSTEALANRYGVRGNAIVLPNCVPEAYLEVEPNLPKMQPTIGWAGFTHSHPGDLNATRGGVAQAVDELNGRFLVIGDGKGVADALGFPGGLTRDTFDITGPVPFLEYPEAVAQLDVGIVPLAKSAFNDAKSWLKGLEYAALGVPFVATPTIEYERLAGEGIGFLAERPRDWRRYVTYVYAHREELGRNLRHDVGQRWTYELNGWRWAEAWAEAMLRRARAKLAA